MKRLVLHERVIKMIVEEFWYDCVKPTYREKAKLCYMGTDGFIVYKRTENISLDIMNQTEHCLKKKNKKIVD